MYPTLIELGSNGAQTAVNTYGLFILAAFSVAFLLVHYRATRAGLDPDKLVYAYVAVAVTSMIGSRTTYVLAVEPGFSQLVKDLTQFRLDPTPLLSCAGFVYYGGVLGGAVGVFLCAVYFRFSGFKFLDIIAPALAAGLGVGRLGCFFAGCCHGGPAPLAHGATGIVPAGTLQGEIWLQGSFPFFLTEFHGGVGRLLHEPLYPTQVWSAAFGITLALVLHLSWSKRRFDGQLAAAYLLIEPLARFIIETFRADHRGYVVTFEVSESLAQFLPGMAAAGDQLSAGANVIGLTTSQSIGLGLMACGVGIIATRWNAGVEEEIPFRMEGEDDDDDYDDDDEYEEEGA